jgi:hypothetical protein
MLSGGASAVWPHWEKSAVVALVSSSFLRRLAMAERTFAAPAEGTPVTSVAGSTENVTITEPLTTDTTSTRLTSMPMAAATSVSKAVMKASRASDEVDTWWRRRTRGAGRSGGAEEDEGGVGERNQC